MIAYKDLLKFSHEKLAAEYEKWRITRIYSL